MIRFGINLRSTNCSDRFSFEQIQPIPYFSKILPWKFFNKWTGYIDKFILFPKRLREHILYSRKGVDLIHVIDQSNAVYLPKIKKFSNAKLLTTCHDLIAISSAMGRFHNAPKVSSSGKFFQQWIRKSLEHSDFFACDSSYTEKQLIEIISASLGKTQVIHLGTERNRNVDYMTSLSQGFPSENETEYLLHVGSSAWYKNRNSVLHAFRNLTEKIQFRHLKLFLIGPNPQKSECDRDLYNWVHLNRERIIIFNGVSEKHLDNLYRRARLLLFPSYVEGFGWPPLEAALRGCTVITSKTGAIQDILKDKAHYIDPHNQSQINQKVLEVLTKAKDEIELPTLPSHDDCRSNYEKLYNRILHQ